MGSYMDLRKPKPFLVGYFYEYHWVLVYEPTDESLEPIVLAQSQDPTDIYLVTEFPNAAHQYADFQIQQLALTDLEWQIREAASRLLHHAVSQFTKENIIPNTPCYVRSYFEKYNDEYNLVLESRLTQWGDGLVSFQSNETAH